MKAPFPYFGGKSRIADLVWERFGNVPNYVEPFAGSLAVLLKRPHEPRLETVNDKDCMLANFWRALQADPEAVAHHADWPVNEADLHARHLWLVGREEFRERMKTDPEYFDTQIAGWWVWGICQWIGSGWCTNPEWKLRPHLVDAGKGVHRKLPHLGNAGKGVHRQLPHLGPCGPNNGQGIFAEASRGPINEYMVELSERLRRVRVCCGDWARVTGPSVTFKHGLTGVFLDPPYSAEAGRHESLYSVEDLSVAHDVREWAIANGDNPLMRIALCGYEGEHQMPNSWECIAWKAAGGYGSQGDGTTARDNAIRERIWFSPHCLRPQERFDFGEVTP